MMVLMSTLAVVVEMEEMAAVLVEGQQDLHLVLMEVMGDPVREEERVEEHGATPRPAEVEVLEAEAVVLQPTMWVLMVGEELRHIRQ